MKRAAFWRLVFSGYFSYSEVAAMDLDEFLEASAALDTFSAKQRPPRPRLT